MSARARITHRARAVGRGLGGRALSLAESVRVRRDPPGELGRGIVLIGTVWPGGSAQPFDGVVIVDARGIVDYVGPGGASTVPGDLLVLGGPGRWIGPGVVDAHVHLAVPRADRSNVGPNPALDAAWLRGGVVTVRDLGAPPGLARSMGTGRRRPTGQQPGVAVAGPILTAPRGYPSRSWGRAGFTTFVSSPAQARQVVQRVAAGGADVIKIALEPGEQGDPVPEPGVVRAVVGAAHDAGLACVAHALDVDMVRRAVAAGVDELTHTPSERLPARLVDEIAAARIPVVSTLQTFFTAGVGRSAAQNAADLHRAGVVLRYGTDFGNAGTRAGVDPRELDRLADTGLGRLGALRAATEHAAASPGVTGRTGRLEVGRPAALVLLSADPLAEPGVWRWPLAVIADGRLLLCEGA
jgi:imidazolonepropionase-like amidohydrolase